MIFRMSKTVDFAFLDSKMETRVPELVTLYPMLKDGAIVAVRDQHLSRDVRRTCGRESPTLRTN